MHQVILAVMAANLASATPAQEIPFLPLESPIQDSSAYAQCDPRWRTEMIRNGTLCRVGCAFFALLRAAQEAGYDYEPLEFLELLERHGVFNGQDRIVWGNISRVLPLIARRSQRPADLGAVREFVETGRFVMLEVRSTTTPNGSHWVFVAEVTADDILVDDSRGGHRVSLREAFNNRTIGYAVIERQG